VATRTRQTGRSTISPLEFFDLEMAAGVLLAQRQLAAGVHGSQHD
jgi:hypothetical protein